MKVPIIKPQVGKLTSRVRSLADQTQHYYRTAEHQRWAKDVVDKANGRCQRCGRNTDFRGNPIRLYADHIKEIKDGGTWTESNGQALCGSCHTVKTLHEKAKRWRTPI